MPTTKLRLYKDALRHLADARLSVITDDTESRYALDDAYDQAVEFVTRQAAWRHALKTVPLAAAAGPLPGFSNAYAKPADWLHTHALFILTADGQERPIDIREQGLTFSANLAAGVQLRYVSDDYLDPEFDPWPEHFAQAVGAYLAFLVADRVTGEHGAAGRMSQLFSSLIGSAEQHDALPENPWLQYQLDGTFIRLANFLANQSFWRFALKTVLVDTPTGAGEGGLANRFDVPDDWGMTRELYVLTARGEHRPLDIREHGQFWHTNAESFYAEYISSDLTARSDLWPDQYLQALARLLTAERGDAEAKDQKVDFQFGLAAVSNATQGEAIPENPWLEHQLSGAFARCMPAVIARGWWRFALKTLPAAAPGPLPADWTRTHALFLLTADGREHPFDIREHGRQWQTTTSAFHARYVSTDAYDSMQWPESLAKAVLAYLELDEDDEEAADTATQGQKRPTQDKAALWQGALAAALEEASEPEDPWLEHQLSGAYARCMPAVISQGWWRFALKTVQLMPQNELQGGPYDLVYPHRWAVPDDWVMSHALFINWGGMECPIDIKERGRQWQTATPVFLARYLSTDAYDATLWPESLAKAVLAYLELDEDDEEEAAEQPKGQKTPLQDKASVWQAALSAALDEESEPTHPWTRHQLSGQFLQCARWVLEQARWRFAIRSVVLEENNDPMPGDDGTAQHGYGHRFLKPNDWLRTIWFGRQINEGLAGLHVDTDYIDEGLTLHANWAPLSLRYLSTEKGLDPTQWTAHFRDALLAYLEHIEARANPKLASLAAERFKFFQMQLREAESNDDNRDGPLYRQVGRVVRARYGWGRGYGIGPGYGPSQGWWG